MKASKNEYPLAYVRSSGEGEKILIIINPSEKEVTFSCDLKKVGGVACHPYFVEKPGYGKNQPSFLYRILWQHSKEEFLSHGFAIFL